MPSYQGRTATFLVQTKVLLKALGQFAEFGYSPGRLRAIRERFTYAVCLDEDATSEGR